MTSFISEIVRDTVDSGLISPPWSMASDFLSGIASDRKNRKDQRVGDSCRIVG
ncbi:hypothetical protein [Zymomonas mobilis]|uniref:hypothetical protein n=1 Tax=Zymomonas mobilis TaxID=542 RepID=UPI0021C2ADB8|nr:hypothetical protein [Zymomonas mobilis]MCP9308503.1 hypothetical protein [Zymomonas mobilis]